MVGFKIIFQKKTSSFILAIKLSKIPQTLYFQNSFSKNPAFLLKLYSTGLPTCFNLTTYSLVFQRICDPFFFYASPKPLPPPSTPLT